MCERQTNPPVLRTRIFVFEHMCASPSAAGKGVPQGSPLVLALKSRARSIVQKNVSPRATCPTTKQHVLTTKKIWDINIIYVSNNKMNSARSSC